MLCKPVCNGAAAQPPLQMQRLCILCPPVQPRTVEGTWKYCCFEPTAVEPFLQGNSSTGATGDLASSHCLPLEFTLNGGGHLKVMALMNAGLTYTWVDASTVRSSDRLHPKPELLRHEVGAEPRSGMRSRNLDDHCRLQRRCLFDEPTISVKSPSSRPRAGPALQVALHCGQTPGTEGVCVRRTCCLESGCRGIKPGSGRPSLLPCTAAGVAPSCRPRCRRANFRSSSRRRCSATK